MLDGEGGYTVWGRLLPAADSLARRALPIGLAHKVRLKRAIAEGEIVSWDDVEYDADSEAVQIRREMERTFGGGELSRQKSLETPIAADVAPIAADKD
jgi:predicted homoserine dehydrogenase-like protein